MSSAFMPRQSELDEDLIEATIVSPPKNLLPTNETRLPTEPRAHVAERSMLERFVDSFFRRENIRWIAVIGAAIVVASSLMMVTREWASWPVMAKFLTILGYTGLTYFLSDWGRKHLGLQITARVLQFLTLLLLPICFLSLSWLFGPSAEMVGTAGLQMALLIVPALGLAYFTSSRIFEYLWRGKQHTFLASYLLLCMAGALPRLHDAWPAALVTFALWLIATVGSIKINRHVFWITEEHRLPRAFGFLPIALLGIQFLTLVAIKTGLALPVEWLGLGLVLMSATVLMTARAVADVHRQRIGGIVRPLPWNIIVPLVIGVAMSLLGVAVSMHGFSYGAQTTYAIVPSALIAGLLMFQATRETNQRAFVWIGLVLFAISYQCAPTLFAGLVQQVKASAASAVGEERLPIAFYGLSYLPFLLAVAFGSTLYARRGRPAFAIPMRHFVTAVTFALFALSWMHVKAVFPVAVVNLCLFTLYAVLFRDRRYMLPSIAALTVAVATWIPFVNAMQIADVHLFHIVTSLSFLATALAALPQLDRLINRLPQPSRAWSEDMANLVGEPAVMCRRWSTVLTLTMAPLWAAIVLFSQLYAAGLNGLALEIVPNLQQTLQLSSNLPLIALLANFAMLTVRTRSPYYSLGMWTLAGFATLTTAFMMHVPLLYIANASALVMVVINLATMFPLRRLLSGRTLDGYTAMFASPSNSTPTLPLSVTFLLPLHALTSVVVMVLASVFVIPEVILSNLLLTGIPADVAVLSLLVWLVALKVVFSNRVAGVAAAIAFPLVCTSVLLNGQLISAVYSNAFTITYSTLPLIWTFAAVLVSLVAYRSVPTGRVSIQSVAVTWVLVCAVLSLSSFDLIARMTAMVALTSFAITERKRFKQRGWTILAIASTVQLLMLVAGLSGMHHWLQIVFQQAEVLAIVPNIALALALCSLVWDVRRLRLAEQMRLAFASVIRVMFLLATSITFAIQSVSPAHIVVMLLAFAVAVAVEVIEAIRRQNEGHIWSSIAIAFAALAWMVVHGQLVIGSGASQIALISVSAFGLIGARVIQGHKRLGFAARPLDQLGLVCPAFVVGLTLTRTALGQAGVLPGIDSAMLLAAAAIYFYRGLATSSRGLMIAAVLVFNVASVHLWLTLSMNDLQLYLVPLGLTVLGLVELLKKEIPVAAHGVMRNIGSLVILVSPVFEILGGSWLHMATLLLLSVLVILLAIGLRIRTLVYMGTAFLFADLLAMVIQSAVANPGMLWIGGLATGVAVIALAAYCENHREQLLSKIRVLSAELATWN